MKLKTVTLMLN